MLRFDLPPVGAIREPKPRSQQRRGTPDLLRQAQSHAPHGEVRVGRRAQLDQVIGLAEVEGHQDSAVVSVRHNVRCHIGVPGSQRAVGLSRGLHGGVVGGLDPRFHQQARHGVPEIGREALRSLRHHPMSLQLEVGALIEHDLG